MKDLVSNRQNQGELMESMMGSVRERVLPENPSFVSLPVFLLCFLSMGMKMKGVDNHERDH